MTVFPMHYKTFFSPFTHLISGDEFVCTDLESMLPKTTYESAEYGKGRRKVLDRPSTHQDVAEFAIEYLSSDVRIHH